MSENGHWGKAKSRRNGVKLLPLAGKTERSEVSDKTGMS